MKSRRCAREVALQALYQCDTTDDWSPHSIDLFFTHFRAESHDEEEGEEPRECHLAFSRAIVDGVIAQRAALDEHIGAASTHWTVPRMARVDRNILRIATWEMLHEADIPLNVSINEAIEIAKRFGSPETPTFVNGVLDKIAHSLSAAGLCAGQKTASGRKIVA